MTHCLVILYNSTVSPNSMSPILQFAKLCTACYCTFASDWWHTVQQYCTAASLNSMPLITARYNCTGTRTKFFSPIFSFLFFFIFFFCYLLLIFLFFGCCFVSQVCIFMNNKTWIQVSNKNIVKNNFKSNTISHLVPI